MRWLYNCGLARDGVPRGLGTPGVKVTPRFIPPCGKRRIRISCDLLYLPDDHRKGFTEFNPVMEPHVTYTQVSVRTNCLYRGLPVGAAVVVGAAGSGTLATNIQLPCVLSAAWGATKLDDVGQSVLEPKAA